MNYSYTLKFLPMVLKEWKKLDFSIQSQFKKKLRERLEAPHHQASQLSRFENYYKIKLRASGYRLVYEVIDQEICVLVIAVGKRDMDAVYKQARQRTNKQ
ncbi:MAG: type II toxin-antitoxin system RelE/ParE family toxin [Proteobacteria bacterium]|nr:type II toxin-antitoxin system RelE/ParE family toxin [Pseudomonadota bacterium]MBU4297455.1 type II toxin-antitoxin system RelE/ParE family toxin [Pseudomonadota bacterium]MCG2746438.1 type II toxin-antitoxin system RelE/ParE family toxin [Desulfobulbaceae bacterium]